LTYIRRPYLDLGRYDRRNGGFEAPNQLVVLPWRSQRGGGIGADVNPVVRKVLRHKNESQAIRAGSLARLDNSAVIRV
jgi:hypothetical protein